MASTFSTLNRQTVRDNLQVLADLQQGEKLIIDPDSGRIRVDVTYWGRSARRWWSGAFNTEAVQSTFQRAQELIEESRSVSEVSSGSHYVELETEEDLTSLFNRALVGVYVLKHTYKGEDKKTVCKELKEIWKHFKEQAKQFNQEVSSLPVKDDVEQVDLSESDNDLNMSEQKDYSESESESSESSVPVSVNREINNAPLIEFSDEEQPPLPTVEKARQKTSRFGFKKFCGCGKTED